MMGGSGPYLDVAPPEWCLQPWRVGYPSIHLDTAIMDEAVQAPDTDIQVSAAPSIHSSFNPVKVQLDLHFYLVTTT
ncbi:hypothetical protein Tco_0511956 [Tanacetum coccineum]